MPNNRIIVGLVQINNSFSNQDYFPYSVGLLQAYVQANAPRPSRYDFLLPVFRRLAVDDAVRQLAGAQVIGFSVYVWNYRISLEIARRIKEVAPQTLIVFGGPHVPDGAGDFVRQHRYVDMCCHGEGEQVFLKILENYPSRDWSGIPSISYLNEQGQMVSQSKVARLRDLLTIPSPYLTGVFEGLLRANPQHQWLALWETNRGCPFQCTFCDWGSAIQTKVAPFEMQRLFAEIDWFANHQVEFIFCCDANYGILPRDLEITQYVVQAKTQHGYPRALSVQNTKNATDRAYQVQKLLSDHGLNKGVAIALQSIDPATLISIKRQNISTETYQELQRRFTRDNVETYTDLILGLPGETYDSFADGTAQVIAEGQHNRIQFNNLSILPNAEMGSVDYQTKYGMELVESKIINIHGSLTEPSDGIVETQELVIATRSMPRADWIRARIFSWMAALLHFDKILQIPFILIHELTGLSYRNLIEAFVCGDYSECPILLDIGAFFKGEAHKIQSGGAEYCQSVAWLNIWWPADEYVFIKLSVENRLNAFYQEAELVLSRLLRERDVQLPPQLLPEAVDLNRSLVKQPFQVADLDVDLSYNIWEVYRGTVRGRPLPLQPVATRYHIDRTSEVWSSWDDWCRQVVWYGNKKGAYLYGNQAVSHELAGHY